MGGDALRLHFRPARGRGAGQEIDGERARGGRKQTGTERNYTLFRFTVRPHGASIFVSPGGAEHLWSDISWPLNTPLKLRLHL